MKTVYFTKELKNYKTSRGRINAQNLRNPPNCKIACTSRNVFKYELGKEVYLFMRNV